MSKLVVAVVLFASLAGIAATSAQAYQSCTSSCSRTGNSTYCTRTCY